MASQGINGLDRTAKNTLAAIQTAGRTTKKFLNFY